MLPSPSSPAHLGTVPTLNATLLLEKEGPLLYLPWGRVGAPTGEVLGCLGHMGHGLV